jgi:hypothetical protein
MNVLMKIMTTRKEIVWTEPFDSSMGVIEAVYGQNIKLTLIAPLIFPGTQIK